MIREGERVDVTALELVLDVEEGAHVKAVRGEEPLDGRGECVWDVLLGGGEGGFDVSGGWAEGTG